MQILSHFFVIFFASRPLDGKNTTFFGEKIRSKPRHNTDETPRGGKKNV